MISLKSLKNALSIFTFIFIITGCGDEGEPGVAGPAGTAGTPGISIGTIIGTITDSTNTALEGASITINPSDGTATSAADGTYTIADLPIGVYTVSVVLNGYNPAELNNISVTAGVTITADVQMSLVTVTSLNGTAMSGVALDEYVILTLSPDAGGADIIINIGADGTFNEVTFDAGIYDITATRPGYEDYTQANYVVLDATTNVLDINMTALPVDTYIGTDECGVCHAAKHASFIQTGHPYKLNKVVDGTPPTYPFTDLTTAFAGADVITGITDDGLDGSTETDNTLGTPNVWSDITYVIGGYNWKARFTDADGYIVTGSSVQFNFATEGFVAYHDDEVDKPFNCGNCHTTAWKHTDTDTNPGVLGQDGLPGMHGKFFKGGIQCEACHGPGSIHAQDLATASITLLATPSTSAEKVAEQAAAGDFATTPLACGECHTRDGERDYPTYVSAFDQARLDASKTILPMGGRVAAKGGLIKHHEQYDEILGIDPATLESVRSEGFMGTHGNCMNCHNTHGSAVNDTPITGVDRSNAACETCHVDKDPALRTGGMTSLKCVDCHMPKIIKNATSMAAVGTGPITGDISTHLFKIDLSGQQFTGDGKFANPLISTDYACRTCHNGDFASGGTFDVTDGVTAIFTFHNN